MKNEKGDPSARTSHSLARQRGGDSRWAGASCPVRGPALLRPQVSRSQAPLSSVARSPEKWKGQLRRPSNNSRRTALFGGNGRASRKRTSATIGRKVSGNTSSAPSLTLGLRITSGPHPVRTVPRRLSAEVWRRTALTRDSFAYRESTSRYSVPLDGKLPDECAGTTLSIGFRPPQERVKARLQPQRPGQRRSHEPSQDLSCLAVIVALLPSDGK